MLVITQLTPIEMLWKSIGSINWHSSKYLLCDKLLSTWEWV